MNNKIIKIVLALLIVIAAVFVLRFVFGGPEDTWICENGQWIKHGNPSSPMPTEICPGASPTPTVVGYSDLIKVTAPANNQIISSPFIITGEARGTWYFEASFPVELRDGNDKIIVQTYASAKSDWMTEDFVSFESKLEFTTPTTETGSLILRNDNPSGLPENDKEITIPVRFK